mgnify:CR=1 FL=1
MYKNILKLVIVYLIVTGTAVALPDKEKSGNNCPSDLGKNSSIIRSEWQSCIRSTLDMNAGKLLLSAGSKTDGPVQDGGLVVEIDDRRVADFSYNLSADERWEKSINVSSHLDVVPNNHTVTVSTY